MGGQWRRWHAVSYPKDAVNFLSGREKVPLLILFLALSDIWGHVFTQQTPAVTNHNLFLQNNAYRCDYIIWILTTNVLVFLEWQWTEKRREIKLDCFCSTVPWCSKSGTSSGPLGIPNLETTKAGGQRTAPMNQMSLLLGIFQWFRQVWQPLNGGRQTRLERASPKAISKLILNQPEMWQTDCFVMKLDSSCCSPKNAFSCQGRQEGGTVDNWKVKKQGGDS